VRGHRRVVIVRHAELAPHFYDVFLEWLAQELPEVRSRFELRSLPFLATRWSRYAACVLWLQDPPDMWSPSGYRLATRLVARCDARGIPLVNRVERLANAGKSMGARLIATAGLRTPRMAFIDDEEEFRRTRLGIPLPMFVREDWGHGGPLLRADTAEEARSLPVRNFRLPVAVELIDLPNPDDGLYRKYRYVVAGDTGVPQSMHVSEDWLTRGGPEGTVFNDAVVDEEIDFIGRQEPNHAHFVAARKALGLDFVAFDYSLDASGRPVVWEANPYPLLHLPAGRRDYRGAATRRVFAAMAKLYLERAGLEVPAAVEQRLVG
jgi:hypothetical protein